MQHQRVRPAVADRELELRDFLALLDRQLGLLELHVAEEGRRFEILHEAASAPGCRPCGPETRIVMTSFGITVSMRFGGWLRFLRGGRRVLAAFGVTTTLLLPCGVPVNADAGEPRVLRQRAADLVHDVRPDVPVFVDAVMMLTWRSSVSRVASAR